MDKGKWGRNIYKCGCVSTLMETPTEKHPEGELKPVIILCDKHGKMGRLGIKIIK